MLPTSHQKTEGIILRRYPFRESSLIIHWFTPDRGKVKTLAKGALKPNSSLAQKLDLFYWNQLSFIEYRDGDLHMLQEVAPVEWFPKLRTNYDALRLATYAAKLIEKVTEPNVELRQIFGLLASLLSEISCGHSNLGQALIQFELKLLEDLGLGPQPGKTGLSKSSASVAEALRAGGWKLEPLANEHEIKEIGQFLNGFLTYHLGTLPTGRNFHLGNGTPR